MADRTDRRDRPRVDASRRTKEHSSGDRQSLKIPEGLTLFNPKKPGVFKLEIIPYAVTKSVKRFIKNYADPGQLYYERTFFTHGGIGVNNESFACLAKNFGKPCPICEHRAAKAKSTSKDDEELVYALKPKERQLFLILDHAEPHKGIQLWEVSHWCFGKQLDAKLSTADPDDVSRYNAFADPEDGLTLRVVATEESMGSGGGKFLKFGVDEFRARKEALDPDLFEHGFNLDDMVRELSYDELKKIFLQSGDEDDDAPAKPKGKDKEPEAGGGGFAKPNKPKPKPADDDGDDDEPTPKTKVKEEPAAAGFKKGDEVQFSYKEKVWTGKVESVNADTGIAMVACEGRERPFSVDVDELKKVKGGKPKPTDDDDDQDEQPARKPKPKEEPAATKPKAKPRDDDDDDEPPAKPKPKSKPADDDDDDPPAKPSRKPAADDDDEPPAKPNKPKPKPKDDDDDWDD